MPTMRIDDLPMHLQEQARAQLGGGSSRAGAAPDAIDEPPSKVAIAHENALQRLCELELNRRGIKYLHLSYRAREKAGWPDLTFALPGRPMAVELKTATGKPSNVQIEMLSSMKANGWETYVLRELEVFIELLNGQPICQWGRS